MEMYFIMDFHFMMGMLGLALMIIFGKGSLKTLAGFILFIILQSMGFISELNGFGIFAVYMAFLIAFLISLDSEVSADTSEVKS